MAVDELLGLQGGRILVIHQGAVGDLVLALPAIKVLRESLRPAWLEMLGHLWTLPVAHRYPYADAIGDINTAALAPLFQADARLTAEICRYCGGFDAAFCFSQSTTLAQNLRKAGIQKTFTLPSFPQRHMHVTDHHLASVQALGITAPPALPQIALSAVEKTWVKEFFLQQGWDMQGIIALHPGAGSRKKAWPPYRFAALARALASEANKILLIQGPADEEAVAAVRAHLRDIPYLHVHNVPIDRLVPLLSCFSLFIGNDSGISHLAAALGVPTLAIFGPTDPLVWAPRGTRALWLQGKAACAPCTREQQQTCEQQRCLAAIGVADVMTFLTEKKMLTHAMAFQQEKARTIEKSGHEYYGEKGIGLLPTA
jgi:ADP-heptose:LPS heptosyltransferase